MVGVFSGIAATARVVFAPIPILLALLLWSRSRVRAAVVGLVGLATGCVLHAVFAIGIAPYPPFHLFDRASDRQPA